MNVKTMLPIIIAVVVGLVAYELVVKKMILKSDWEGDYDDEDYIEFAE